MTCDHCLKIQSVGNPRFDPSTARYQLYCAHCHHSMDVSVDMNRLMREMAYSPELAERLEDIVTVTWREGQ